MANDSVITQQKLKEYHETYVYPFLNGISTKGDQAFVPCGKIEGFMRTTAPKGYLVCDGTEYLKSAYPSLAALLASVDTAQSTTNFVGSDSDHFKVPDLRGEFLRGTGTNSHTNQGSGATVGTHQDGTTIPVNWIDINGDNYIYGNGVIRNPDSSTKAVEYRAYAQKSYGTTSSTNANHTSRPTNTSVLYCIAYQDLYLTPGHTYSTDEQVVGTWIDGKPLYEKTMDNLYLPSVIDGLPDVSVYPLSGISIDKVISIKGVGKTTTGIFLDINSTFAIEEKIYYTGAQCSDNTQTSTPNSIRLTTNRENMTSYVCTVTVRYTKTTDTV